MYGRRKAKPIGFSNHDDPRRLVIRSEDSNPPPPPPLYIAPPELVPVGIHYIIDLDNVEETEKIRKIQQKIQNDAKIRIAAVQRNANLVDLEKY